MSDLIQEYQKSGLVGTEDDYKRLAEWLKEDQDREALGVGVKE